LVTESTLVGWTGLGSIADLKKAVRRVLKLEGVDSQIRVQGSAIRVDGGRPTEVADFLAYMPGVSWIAVGHSSDSVKGVFGEIASLARIYLKKRTFAIVAETSSREMLESDVVGRAVSAVFDAVPGSKVDEDSPSVTFRVAMGRKPTRDGGVAGVELRKGAGGTPTGATGCLCLVSGGMHSSVMTWYALLSGMRVELVHVAASDESLREVARLYGELSHRVDPSAVGLRVVEGVSVRETIRMLRNAQEGRPIYAGFHCRCNDVRPAHGSPRGVASPLYLLPEHEFSGVLSSLGLRGYPSREAWTSARRSGRRPVERRIRGKRCDMHGVLDGLR